MIRHETDVLGSRMAWWERNPEAARTLVLVHGLRGNHKALTPMAQHFADTRLVLVDLPGYGESTPMTRRKHDLRGYAAALEHFCLAAELGRFSLWAHSFGADVALAFAARTRPGLDLDRLVLVSPPLPGRGVGDRAALAYYELGRALPRAVGEPLLASKLMARMTGRMLIKGVSSRRAAAMIAAGQRDVDEFRMDVVTESYLDMYRAPLMRYARRVNRPTLVVAGQLDTLAPVGRLERLAAEILAGELEVVDDSGHLFPLEQPGRCAAIAERFITR